MSLPTRKQNRLSDFDYSLPGAYFITICTKDRRTLFWKDSHAPITAPQDVALSSWGCIVASAIQQIPKHYPAISVDRYVVMPNHVHLLLQIHTDPEGRIIPTPPVSIVIQQLKGYCTKQIGSSIWQKLFHDHVIRNEKDYAKIWEYIENNPCKWSEDCFYTP